MSKVLLFFDFDFTLAKTFENVRIWSPRGTETYNGKITYSLSPNKFNVLNLADDEELNEDSYVEFFKININRAVPIDPILNFLKFYLLDEKNMITILSARPQAVEKDVKSFLIKNHIDDLSRVQFKGCQSACPSKKYDFIKERITTSEIREIFLFEDSKKNIKFIVDNLLTQFQSITLRTCLVSPTASGVILEFVDHVK
ncbi:MAG TPA: hypothetical protein DCM40_36865 [Maribacter sp.]|nr:hypothetical protein [Maribacter sp.]